MGLFNFLRKSASSPLEDAAMRRYVEVEYANEISRATRSGADRETIIRGIVNRIAW